MKRRTIQLAVLVAMLALFGASSAQASFLSSILANGSNSFEDQDREAYVDVNGNNTFDVGDVLLGFIRLDTHLPVVSGVGSINNRIYAIFSQEVDSISGSTVHFRPTTAAGLTLSALTGISAPSGSIVAVYSSSTPITDLITTSPGDLTGNGTTNLFDYFKAIKDNMTLNLIAGFGSGPTNGDDYFTATVVSAALLASGGASLIPNLATSVTVANFTAGLTILQNNDPEVIYNELVQSSNLTLHQLVIANGSVRGTSATPPVTNANEWTKINPDLGYNNPGGFITDADFFVNVTVIPEPGTLALMGSILSVLGVGYVSRRRQMA